MGNRLTAFENRSTSVGMEIRIFVPPARPDQYRRIIRLKPGETKELVTKSLCYENTDPENPTYLMLFMDGVYTGVFLLPLDAVTYAKIICDIHDDGQVNVRRVKVTIPGFRWLKGFSFCLGRREKKQSSPPPPSPSTILGDSRLTAFENRSTTVGMEIRVFVPPARPDQYRRIIRLKPGETKELVTKSLCYENTDPENPTFFMLFMDGVYTGIFLLPLHVVTYAKIICDIHDDRQVNVRGIQVGIPGLRRLRGFSFCLGRGFRSINPRVVHHIGASASVWGGVPVPEQGLRRSNSSINPRAVHHLDCSGSVYLKEGSPTLNKALKL